MNVLIEIMDRMAILTVNRPEARNALSEDVVRDLHAALQEAGESRDVGVVVLTGGGDNVFVSGGDLRQIREKRREQALFEPILQDLFRAVETLDKPTIAAVNGFALGGGCELALCCDFRIAAEGAQFGFPEVGLGIIPAAGGTQRLPRIVGLGRAKELIFLGEIINAQRALEIGLVHRVVPALDLLSAAKKLAQKLISRGPLALQLAKRALQASANTPLETGLFLERIAQAICFESHDKCEGTTAFLEKRKPIFKGE